MYSVSRLLFLLAGAGVLALATLVPAGPSHMRALKFANGPKKTTTPGVGTQAYYYSDGRKVYLGDTGLAVVKLKNPKMDEKELKFQPIVPEAVNPLSELAPVLRRSGFVMVRTQGPNGLDLHKAMTDHVDQIENLLPIVQTVSSQGARSPSRMIVTERITAQFAQGLTQNDITSFVKEFGLKVVRPMQGVPNGYYLQLSKGPVNYTRLLQAANRLYVSGKEGNKVSYSHPDFVPVRKRQQAAQILDPDFPKQWHLNNDGSNGGRDKADVRALDAWKITKGKREIRVAIIDDSVEKDHPDLKDNYVAGRYYNGLTGTTTNDPSPLDGEQRHGTCCAGVAVARSNAFGGCGIAPECGLIGIHIWDGSAGQTAEAFHFAKEEGAAIISCSWSWQQSDVFDAVSKAVKDIGKSGRDGKGVVVLFAAGNEAGLIARNQWMGKRDEVICVGASNWRDDHSPYSNHGPELSIVAPSGDRWWIRPEAPGILTTDNTERMPRNEADGFSGYTLGDFTPATGNQAFNGTSSATPLAAGVCALILSKNPTLTARQVREILEGTADPIPGELRKANYVAGRDSFYGHGRVNAKKAVDKAATMPGALP